MKKRNISYVKISYFIAMILFLSSCSSTNTVHELYYNLDCNNCGTTPDGILTLDIIRLVDPKTDLEITVKNNKDDIVLFDERYFTLTQSNILVQNPIGLDNPNLSKSWTNSYSSSVGVTTPYVYNSLYRYWSKYDNSASLSRSYTESTIPQPLIILPPNSILKYILNDYIT